MATVEAAASLFGAEDSSSDPFASLGLNEEKSPPAGQHGPTQASSNYWEETFGQPSGSHTGHSHIQSSHASAPSEVSLSAYSQSTSTRTRNADSSIHNYTQEPAPDVHSSNSWLSGDDNQNRPQPANYSAYVPSYSSDSAATASTLPYDPYAPASAQKAVYAPSQLFNASVPPALTAATNIRTTPLPHNGAAYQSHNQTPYSTPDHPAIPAPPPPTASLVRPKIVNAYDPPFPTTKSARRANPQHGITQQAPAYPSPYTNSTGSPYANSPQNAYSSYPTPPQVGLPIPNGSAGHENHWKHHHAPPYSPPANPVDGLPVRNDALSGLCELQGDDHHHHHSSHNPYAPPSYKTLRTTQPNLGLFSPIDSEPQVLQSTFPQNRPLLPSGGHASGSEQAVIELRSDVLDHKSPPLRNSTPGCATLSPAQEYVAQSMASSSMSRTASPASLHSHSRKSSHDITPPRRIYTPDSNGPNMLQRATSPLIDRTFSPGMTPLQRTTSPASVSYAGPRESRSPTLGPYAPKAAHGPPSLPSQSSTIYAVPAQTQAAAATFSDARARSVSTLSSGSTHSSQSLEDPYTPAQVDHRQTHPLNETYYSVPQFSQPHPSDPSSSGHPSSASPEQEIIVKPAQNLYAPSPSLLASNDPLGRTSARGPIVSFGFGGKLVTCFHGADTLNTGFDVALSARNSTGIQIRVLHKLVPQSALDPSSASFPGPLFSDPGTPTSLVRGAITQTKNKKARVTKYLEDRAEEISRGLGYLHSDSFEGRREEGKLALVKLLKVMIENDGKLTGTKEIDIATRTALVPRLETGPAATAEATAMIGLGLSSVPDLSEPPLSTAVLRSSALDKIQDFLVRGERKQAYHFALDEKLWAHAMVIASGIDKESWKEAVNEFLKVELGTKLSNPSLHISGREGLRVAYSLFSGQGAAAVQELNPQTQLSLIQPSLTVPQLNPMTPTPLTPNFNTPMSTTPLPSETLSAWPETAAMMIANPITPEISAALTALGDRLASNQWTEAAHVCYLLSPQTSPIGGIGHPSARIVLLGSRSPNSWPGFSKDLDTIILTEIFEFALSLASPAKGQEPFYGFPHLQAYRLIHAMSLTELGHIQLANRYCEAITASLSRGSPYFTSPFMEQLKGLMDRIIGAPNVDKSGSWIGSKLSKPSLDSIGGWLEGRFTKLVTGDSDAASPDGKTTADAQYGPFSHYSSISSATQSARSSPQPSLNAYQAVPATNGHPQIDRASSAMDYIRRKPSPVPRIASASATTTSFGHAASFGQAHQGLYSPDSSNGADHEIVTPRPEDANGGDSQEVGWWGASSYGHNESTLTPTAATFMKVDASVTESTGGFISLMDTPSYELPYTPQSNGGLHQAHDADDEEDLGLGNASNKKAVILQGAQDSTESSPTPKAAEPQQHGPEASSSSTGSWFSRWWKGSDKSSPIKANLGEETSFYYDPELKRWVNKKAAADTTVKPTAPPPPSRARTASPGVASPSLPAVPSNAPPPARAASAIDLSTSPPSKTVMRVRSNLAPPTTESAPSTPTGLRLSANGGPPPPARPKSQATKRNIRSRYVDVFQAEGNVA